MPIKAITLDFWNTLYYDHQIMYDRHSKRVNFLRETLVRNGYDGKLDLEGSFKFCWEYFDKIWKDESRTLNARELVNVGCKWLGVALPDDEISKVSEYFEEVLLENPPVLFESAKDIISELSGSFKLGIISDTAYTSGRVLRRLLEKDGMLACFDAFTFSDEVGRSKPHISVFRSTLDKLGAIHDEAVHVGDNENTDIKGAIQAGMKSIIFKGAYEREINFTEADFVANDWRELKKILISLAHA